MRLNKQPIRDFMQQHYSDERLAMLLAHAQSGRLTFLSCCCFVGIPTATHSLRGKGQFSLSNFLHTFLARDLPGAGPAERAFHDLGYGAGDRRDSDALRNRRVIPMIRAEMKRREKLRVEQENLQPDCVLAGDAS